MPIGELWDLFADLTNIYELVEEIRGWIGIFGWSINALLDLGLHFLWASASGLLVLYLTYYSMRTAWRFLAAQRRLAASLRAEGEGHIWSFSLLLGCFAAWASHCWWDGLLTI